MPSFENLFFKFSRGRFSKPPEPEPSPRIYATCADASMRPASKPKGLQMNHTSAYPFNSSVPLPTLPQGADAFQPFEPEQWLTVEEVAAQTRVGKAGILTFIKSGELKASFLGRKYLVSRSDLQQFVSNRQRRRQPAAQ